MGTRALKRVVGGVDGARASHPLPYSQINFWGQRVPYWGEVMQKSPNSWREPLTNVLREPPREEMGVCPAPTHPRSSSLTAPASITAGLGRDRAGACCSHPELCPTYSQPRVSPDRFSREPHVHRYPNDQNNGPMFTTFSLIDTTYI